MPRQTKIILRNGTYAEWTAANPTGANNLQNGEPGFENDSGLIKVGNDVNGTRTYNGDVGDYPSALSYVGNFGRSSLSSQDNTDLTGTFPDNYSNINSTTVLTLSNPTVGTGIRSMFLVPFEVGEGGSINTPAISCATSTFVGAFGTIVYNSDEYSRPYKVVSGFQSVTPNSVTGIGIFQDVYATVGELKQGLYWLGVCIFDVTVAGNLTAYAGNSTYIHANSSSTVSGTLLSSVANYNCYLVQCIWQSTTFNYTTTTSRTLTVASTVVATSLRTLDGSFGVYGGIKVGDAVVVYNIADPTEYSTATVTALGTPPGAYTIGLGSVVPFGTLTAASKNAVVLASDFDGVFADEILCPATLTKSHLTPYTGNPPLVRLGG
jgi:hypothetical protein